MGRHWRRVSGRLERSRGSSWLLLVCGALGVVAVTVAAIVLIDEGHDGRRATPAAPGLRAAPPTSLRTVFARPDRVTPVPGRPSAPGRVGVGAPGATGADHVPGRLIVKFEEGTRPDVARKVLTGVDAELEARVDPLDVRVIDVLPAETQDALEAVAASPAVEYVERDVAVQRFATTPNDTLWREQWGLLTVDAPNAWDITTGSPSIVVAVLDSGVDATHPDLRSSLVAGYDFVNGDADPADDDGHGTAAAGVIAARTNNGAGQAGVCWQCSLMPVKVLDASGSGSTSDVAAGIVWAVDHGARVINMSLGSEETTQTLAEAVAYAIGKDVVLVAAAGNSGNANLNYPAAHEGVLGVGATTQSDELYSWSNFGPWVQVAAPGCNVAPYLNGEYVNFCGTSSATPVVAGIAGLALSARPGATRSEVVEALIRSVTTIGGAVRYGRVGAERTLGALGAKAPPAAPSPKTTAPAKTTSPAPTEPARVEPARVETVRGRLATSGVLRFEARFPRAGRVTATLSASSSGSLTVTLVDRRGTAVARASGRSPLRLSRIVSAGRYRFELRSTGRRVPFTLSIASS